MSLLGGSEDKCYVCGKEVDPEEALEEDGKQFCCQECKKHYEDEEKSDEKEVCKFC